MVLATFPSLFCLIDGELRCNILDFLIFQSFVKVDGEQFISLNLMPHLFYRNTWPLAAGCAVAV